MPKLSKKQWVLIAVAAAVLLYLWRRKAAASRRRGDDPGSDPSLQITRSDGSVVS